MASKVEGGESAQDFFAEQVALFGEGFSFSGHERDLLALNRGDGTFIDVSGCSGIDHVGDGRGAVFADFDDDGDADVFLRALHGDGHLLFKNEIGQENGFLRVALRGTESGADAFGARVTVTLAGEEAARRIAQVKTGGSGFLSQHDPRLLFGLGDADGVAEIEVAWPSGRVERLPSAPAGTSLLIVEGEGRWRRVEDRPFELPEPLGDAERAWKRTVLERGDALPELELIDAEPTSGAALAGRPTLVALWASWCGTCRRELPAMKAWAEASEGTIAFVPLAVDDASTRSRVGDAAREIGLGPRPRVLTSEAVSRIFPGGRAVVPTALLLDEEGRVERVLTGWSAEEAERLRESLDL